MSQPVWSLLHRAVDHFADSGDAARQAGGNTLRAIIAGLSLCLVREARASGLLREPAAEREYVPPVAD